EQWVAADGATIADNIGQNGYTGADLDPTPGAFLIESFADNDAPEVASAITLDNDYRIRAADAAGFAVGDAAEWTELTVPTDAAQTATEVALSPLPAKRDDVDTPVGTAVAPMLAGPDG